MQDVLIIIKPDGVQRRLIGEIINRFENKGLIVAGLKMAAIPKDTAMENYSAHKDKDFYDPLIRYMTSSPVVLIALRGLNAVQVARKMVGATFGQNAEPGTIRGDYAISNRFNLVHCSDSPEAAEREIGLFFTDDEIIAYNTTDMRWIYDSSEEKYV